MQGVKQIFNGTVTGLEINTIPFAITESIAGFFITNDTDIELSFSLYALKPDALTVNESWLEVLDPSTETQIVYTVAAGEEGYRLFSGSPSGVRYKLYCDAQLSTGDLTIKVVR